VLLVIWYARLMSLSPWVPRGRVGRALSRADRAVFAVVAQNSFIGGDQLLPTLTRASDRSLLWWAIASGMWASGNPRAQISAQRGLLAVGTASMLVNGLGKSAVRRPRPLMSTVPRTRQLRRLPHSTSFPSGHAASAWAFAVASSSEFPTWRVGLFPLAGLVAVSRVYVGVHYPLDVIAGSVVGAVVGVLVSDQYDAQ
jgi:membrane-associated phospholipid phosphatase